MRPIEKWIWLPEDKYPNNQRPKLNCIQGGKGDAYTVAAFSRRYELKKSIKSVKLRFSGDSTFRLFTEGDNGRLLVAMGPASQGGDFLYLKKPFPNYYSYVTELDAHGDLEQPFSRGELSLYAEVQMNPSTLFMFSRGHGGFMLTAEVTFENGEKTVLMTDETWKAKKLGAYCLREHFDMRNADGEECPAEVLRNIWYTEDSPLPLCVYHPVTSGDGAPLRVGAGKAETFDLPFDKIYACYLSVSAKAPGGDLSVDVRMYETDEEGEAESLYFEGDAEYLGFSLHSAGGLRLTVRNGGTLPAELTASVLASHYPTPVRAVTTTSDRDLDLVTEVCAHTLKYCRQTLHLDSPRHCEPLACTGDYYIETLMTAFTFGDMRLAEFDVRRTAEILRYQDGRMFHTTYSLIWVQMLWDTYMLTGGKSLLSDCEDALLILLERFSGYLGENGLIETPPDYMFIDWLDPDGISLHHPPKALGQTCLCLFYYGALKTAARIYRELGEDAMAAKSENDAETLKKAVIDNLYDAERGLFFEGLNTPSPEELLYEYMPQNVEKRYYRRHANILAAYFGIFDTEKCRDVLRRVWEDDSLGEVQPYFTHFWLEAIYRNGLRDEMTLPLLDKWKEPVKECSKGLAEGFYKPEPTYHFDHSHAWGGTPACALPKALSGIEILEPGYKKISLSPSLLGLDSAHVDVPTPFGMLTVDLEKGSEPRIFVPDGITM
ncbi:MAG: hypothetical protein MJ096_03105 [Clostridia bacterium]|nr:hypothetical protein [Clostridia bacterium]